MSKETQRRRQLAGGHSKDRISENRTSALPKGVPAIPPPGANTPYGERSSFLKVSATISPEVYKLVSDEMQRRRLARLPNAQLSAILREAVIAYLGPRRQD